MYNPTCLITGRKDHLLMYAMRNPSGEMIGWVFIHESVDMANPKTNIQWSYEIAYDDTTVEGGSIPHKFVLPKLDNL